MARELICSGRITFDRDGQEQPYPGLEVCLYDKDLLSDDHLGRCVTGHDGQFRIEFDEDDFSSGLARPFEKGPDLYLVLKASTVLACQLRTRLQTTDAAGSHFDLGTLKIPLLSPLDPNKIPRDHVLQVIPGATEARIGKLDVVVFPDPR